MFLTLMCTTKSDDRFVRKILEHMRHFSLSYFKECLSKSILTNIELYIHKFRYYFEIQDCNV